MSVCPSYEAFNETIITIKQESLIAQSPSLNHSFSEKGVIEDDVESDRVYRPYLENLLEVAFDKFQSRKFQKSRVAGTIIRMEEARDKDTSGLNSPVLNLKEPYCFRGHNILVEENISCSKHWRQPCDVQHDTCRAPAQATAQELDALEESALHLQEIFCFRGRKVVPQVNISLIKSWIQSCSVQHKRCRFPALEVSKEENIRLIDVQDYTVISATTAAKYVALSYVWGPATTPLLTRDNISQCSSLRGLKELIIPRTISDAIHLATFIGMRYIWVDSLCIIQDDDKDKQQQLPIMASIYSSAELVVVAAAGNDANAGLPGIQNAPRYVGQRVETINGTTFITAQPSLQQVLDWSVWNSRGWTFQEAIFSRRAVVFTENLVYWNCRTDTWREDIGGESSLAGLELTEANSIRCHWFRRGTCNAAKYRQIVEAFSLREFKEDRDVIWAVIGVIRLQALSFRKRFIWGLPYEKLDASLLWYESFNFDRAHSRYAHHAVVQGNRLYNLPYPSWSWLSTTMPVCFVDTCWTPIVSDITWHEPFKLGDKTMDTYLKSISPKGFTETHEDQINASLLAETTSVLDIMDYGLLQCTAQTAVLMLRRAEESSHNSRTGYDAVRNDIYGDDVAGDNERVINVDQDETEQDETDQYEELSWEDVRVSATIHSSSGEHIGTIAAPLHFFDEESECFGEFVLLSSNARRDSDDICKEITTGPDCGSINHVTGCKHIQSKNIMLIKWDGDIAYRLALGMVENDKWKKVETQVKRIILG